MFIITPIIAIIVAIAIPNMLSSIQRGRQKSTMRIMQEIGRSIETMKSKDGYPVLRSIKELNQRNKNIHILDGWGHEIRIFSEPGNYYIISLGKDGKAEFSNPASYPKGPTMGFDRDIVYSNGNFIRKPEEARD